MTPEEWRDQVGRHVEARRESLDMSRRAAAKKSGLSEGLWRQVESGERVLAKDVVRTVNPKPDTRARIADALDWPRRAIEQLLMGEAPTQHTSRASDERTLDCSGELASPADLRQAMRDERERRGWSMSDMEVGGYVTEVYERFENGGAFNEDVRVGVCIAFQWPPTWPYYIAAGRDPNTVAYAEYERFQSDINGDVRNLSFRVEDHDDDLDELKKRLDALEDLQQWQDVDELKAQVSNLTKSVEAMGAAIARLEGRSGPVARDSQ